MEPFPQWSCGAPRWIDLKEDDAYDQLSDNDFPGLSQSCLREPATPDMQHLQHSLLLILSLPIAAHSVVWPPRGHACDPGVQSHILAYPAPACIPHGPGSLQLQLGFGPADEARMPGLAPQLGQG